MPIYEINADYTNYKSFYPVEDDENFELETAGYYDFKGKPRNDWNDARVYLEEAFDEDIGKLKTGDIAQFCSGSLAYSEKAVKLLKPILEQSGELLPFEYENQTWYVHNISNSPNAINFEESEYEILNSGKTMYTRVALDEHKLNDISVFTLEAENHSIIRCHEVINKELDFKYQIEKHGLTGLEFNEI